MNETYLSKMKSSLQTWSAVLIVLILLTSGCAKQVQLSVVKPAEVNTRGIKKVAVGSFEIAEMAIVYKTERNGKWSSEPLKLTDQQKASLSNQIRAGVVGKLSMVPYFNLAFEDKFEQLENDTALQQAIAAGGYRTAEADAVINGKIWLEVTYFDGVELEKADLQYKQGGRKGDFNYTIEVVAFWPYKSVSGTLGLEMKLTRLNPTEVIAVTFDTRSYRHKIGGVPSDIPDVVSDTTKFITSSVVDEKKATKDRKNIEESELVLPGMKQLVADLTDSIAAQFIQRVSISQEKVTYAIADGSDSTIKMLIEAGAYQKAIRLLTRSLNRSDSKNPDDHYNLGLCFEAVGEYGLAGVSYEDAIKANPNNLLYAKGAGRIDRIKRENRRLRQQISEKSN